MKRYARKLYWQPKENALSHRETKELPFKKALNENKLSTLHGYFANYQNNKIATDNEMTYKIAEALHDRIVNDLETNLQNLAKAYTAMFQIKVRKKLSTSDSLHATSGSF